MDAGMWKIITLAEISIALHEQDTATSKKALEAMLSEATATTVHKTGRAATFAEIASALLVSGRETEAATWLELARENIPNENNPFETVMGIVCHHLHRGDVVEAVSTFQARPGGYSGNVTAFHMPFVEHFLAALAAANRDDLDAAIFTGIPDNHERFKLMKRYAVHLLPADRPGSALALVAHAGSHHNELLEVTANHA